jgi:hypothetical protein
MKPLTPFTGLPSGERNVVGTPKKARKIRLDPSTNIQSAKET